MLQKSPMAVNSEIEVRKISYVGFDIYIYIYIYIYIIIYIF
jgi:hypothetical protein